MSNLPVSLLYRSLDQKLGKDAWKEFEVETIYLETGLPYSDLLLDKLNVALVIANKPDLFFEDVLFMIFATAVMNGESASFEYLPHITSLELAYAIHEMAKILEVELHALPEFSQADKYFIRDLLVNEGYSEVLPPFDVVGVGQLPKGQTEEDTNNKRKAIESYLHVLNS